MGSLDTASEIPEIAIRRATILQTDSRDQITSPQKIYKEAQWKGLDKNEMQALTEEVGDQLGLPVRGLYFFHNDKVYIGGDNSWKKLWDPLKNQDVTPAQAADYAFLLGGWWTMDKDSPKIPKDSYENPEPGLQF